MEEQELNIVQNGQYKNLNLKTRYKRNPDGSFILKDNQKVKEIDGLEEGNFIIVEKSFIEGREIVKPSYTLYSCGVKYKDTEVSFILNEREHDKYKVCGGIGDKVKITLNKEVRVNPKTGLEFMVDVLSFERVE